METSGIIPTMNVGQNDGFGFGGSGLWIFAILILFMFGGGNWGRQGANPATVEDLNASASSTRLENQIRANAELTERKTDAINNGLATLGYEIANKFADTNERIANGTAQIKDLMYQNKIEALQSQVNQLQMAQATSGVVRYPMSTAYSVPSPCFNCGCNGNI